MKRKLLLLITSSLFAMVLMAQQNATDLFISEYCEWSHQSTDPQTFNHYVEIYNGTGAAVDLTKYQLWRAKNGGGWGMDATIEIGPFPLAGTLANGKTFVIARPVEDGSEVTADMRWSFMNISGDDALGLAKDDGTGTFVLLDVFGTPDEDPGSAWDVGDSIAATINHTLIRKPDICSPTTDWATSAGTSAANSQWIVKQENDSTDVHLHTTQCTGTVSVYVNDVENDVVFPIPNNGSFKYQTSKAKQVRVIDITGRTISTFKVVAGVNNVNIDLPSGMYLLTTEKNESVSRMVIKE
ncbi:MAG: lamin tail domain-containing protein [Bacteroidales bacterium]|nr:lamin tail domain-containing protein [Bacteroidales bacterium]MCF8390931.1 lamin tail domain-containing protein [Bacteroidales bacterium]